MYNMVKLGFIAFVFLLISCSSDFPAAPEFKFCKLPSGVTFEKNKCPSIHVFSESDYCEKVGGKIVETLDDCKETETD